MCVYWIRPKYSCDNVGIYVNTPSAYLCHWQEIRWIQVAKVEGGEEGDAQTSYDYFLFIGTPRGVIKTDTSFENSIGFWTVLNGLRQHLAGFDPNWEEVVDRHYRRKSGWNSLFAAIFYKDRVLIYSKQSYK